MKRLSILLMLLMAMTIGSHRAFAQSVTITLMPGWNWISYPNAVSMGIDEALGDFEPVQGDRLKSMDSSTEYDSEWGWEGELETLVPGQGYMYYSARTEAISFAFVRASSSTVTTTVPTDITATSAVVGGTVTLPEGSHVFLCGVCWGTEPNPNIDGDHTSEETGTGSFSSTLDSLTPNTTYYVQAYVVWDGGLEYGDEWNFTTFEDHDYVDLGLPSGLLWATCNVGADTPEEYGDYFAWGETQPKGYYYWNTYRYSNGSDNTLTKYCNDSSYGYNGFIDNLTILLPEDDAATANWGNDWRLPTYGEWNELLSNTTCTWTTQNGVNGRLFTSSNGNSLFLPAAGYHIYSSFYGAGNYCNYWSISLYTDKPIYVWSFSSDSGGHTGGYRRDCGLSVRAVRSVRPVTTDCTITVTSSPIEGGTIIGGGTYPEGASCTLTATANQGYAFTNWTENGEVISIEVTYSFRVNENRNLVANFVAYSGTAPTGAIDGKFTINANGGQVYFSQGNLQYIGSATMPYWKFAENQWDILGTTTGQNSSDENVDRDFFGWGTSGYNHGAICYQPWSTSTIPSNYWAYGNISYDLFHQTGQADWGYNPISNGGNQENQWRSLTKPEWVYVFNTRTTNSGIRYAKAKVNDVNGVILLPDGWSTNYYSLSNTNSGDASFTSNIITATQWATLEQHGAVFLPAAGSRDGGNVGIRGNYWSASCGGGGGAYLVSFIDSGVYPQSLSFRDYGFSVRLVHIAQYYPCKGNGEKDVE